MLRKQIGMITSSERFLSNFTAVSVLNTTAPDILIEQEIY